MTTTNLIEQCREFDTSIYRDAAHANAGMTAKLQEAADTLEAQQNTTFGLLAVITDQRSQIEAQAKQIEDLRQQVERRREQFASAEFAFNALKAEKEALQAKLSAIEGQEPVAQWHKNDDGSVFFDEAPPTEYERSIGWMPLYAAPVAPAQPLTKEQVEKVLAALESSRVMARDKNGNYFNEVTPPRILEAIEIMKGVHHD